uniref:Uncharacterized protein n=1 Tax=Helianthus annuus TaxID=4232 RepID=A0A251VAR7_HELAN
MKDTHFSFSLIPFHISQVRLVFSSPFEFPFQLQIHHTRYHVELIKTRIRRT